MSNLTIEQLEDLKILMEPTPPFLDALIAEKKTHAELRAEVEAMREDWGCKAERSAGARDNSEHPAKAAHARHLKAHQHVIQRLTDILEGHNK